MSAEFSRSARYGAVLAASLRVFLCELCVKSTMTSFLSGKTLNPELPQMMIHMFPGGFAPVFFGHFPEDGMFFPDDTGFTEPVDHFQQGILFFFEILCSAGGNKGWIGGQALFPGFIVPQLTLEQGPDQAKQEASFGLVGAVGNGNGHLQMGQHLGNIHLAPFRERSGIQSVDAGDDFLFNTGVEEVFDFHIWLLAKVGKMKKQGW